MKRIFIVATFLTVAGCAFPNSVQRIGVEYNTAISGMANELTLLNILRAKEDLPLHYTSLGRLSGSLTVRGTASINGILRADQTTSTNQVATTASANPSAVTTVINQIQEGVDAVTPSVGGELSTGPSFDVAILDSQKFYQGILAAIPFTTVDNFINQGFDDQLLMRLLVERIDFRRLSATGEPGAVLFTWRNAVAGADAATFTASIACYRLSGRNYRPDPVALIPVSRLRRSEAGNLVGLTVQELALLDGTTLRLTRSITAAPGDDAGATVERVAAERRVADLVRRPECLDSAGRPILPPTPPAEPIYLGNDRAFDLAAGGTSGAEVGIRPEIVFRSTESVIRFLGHYLAALEAPGAGPPPFDGEPLFSVADGRPSGAIVTTSLLGRRYSIANDGRRHRNMMIIALVQQLVNLHKESGDRPATVPVQVIGGG